MKKSLSYNGILKFDGEIILPNRRICRYCLRDICDDGLCNRSCYHGSKRQNQEKESNSTLPYLNDILTAYDLAHDNSFSENDGMFDKADVISAIEEFMKAGLEQGYYKQYLDFLQLYNVVNKHNNEWMKDGNNNRQADEYLEA